MAKQEGNGTIAESSLVMSGQIASVCECDGLLQMAERAESHPILSGLTRVRVHRGMEMASQASLSRSGCYVAAQLKLQTVHARSFSSRLSVCVKQCHQMSQYNEHDAMMQYDR